MLTFIAINFNQKITMATKVYKQIKKIKDFVKNLNKK
jgi:hypothetical protein